MSAHIDIAALRAKLRVYDQTLPRCQKRIVRVSNHAPDYVAEEERGEWEMRLTYPCGELEGHEGQCREGRAILGWPGFATLTALLDEVEELRAEIAADEERRLQLLDDAGGTENEVRELRAENERLRDNAEARERVMRREGDLLRAAQREVDELRGIYAALRQTSADLCVVCGWRFFVPGMGCHGCERARLEAEVDDLRLQRAEHISDNMHAYEEGVAEGEHRVVAYMRREADDAEPKAATALLDVSDAIERGEHRREEER